MGSKSLCHTGEWKKTHAEIHICHEFRIEVTVLVAIRRVGIAWEASFAESRKKPDELHEGYPCFEWVPIQLQILG